MSDQPPPSKSLNAKDLCRRYRESLVAVVTVDAKGDEHVGSAFHVGDGAFVTARHVVFGQQSCHVEVAGQLVSIEAKPHPDPEKDVAVFSIPTLAGLPVIPLGGHLDDWICDNDFMLNEVLILGFPPIPLSKRNVLVAFRGQINAVVDLVNVDHVHFIVSVPARGGLSGGVVLSEWEFALGLVTWSLVRDGAAEELGYLTVLTIEPILQCLAAHSLLPRDLALIWDGLFTTQTEYYGVPEKSWAHSWIETDRDGHRNRLSFATPDQSVVASALEAVASLGIQARFEVVDVDVCVLEIDHIQPQETLEMARAAIQKALLDRGYLPVEAPRQIARTLNAPPFSLHHDDHDHETLVLHWSDEGRALGTL